MEMNTFSTSSNPLQPLNEPANLALTARLAGFSYLAMAIAGVLGFIVVHPAVFASGDPAQTLANLQSDPMMARWRILLEFAIVLSQALTAVYFYQFFRGVQASRAAALLVWGTVNAVVILFSAVAMAAALSLAQSGGEAALGHVELLQSLSGQAWGVGGLFFGMWLLPMGSLVLRSGLMSKWLGWTILVGGVGYIVSTFLGYAGVKSQFLDLLTLPATIGEFWIIGYLLFLGFRDKKSQNLM